MKLIVHCLNGSIKWLKDILILQDLTLLKQVQTMRKHRVETDLYGSELHHRSHPLRNHVEILSSFGGNKGKFSVISLE